VLAFEQYELDERKLCYDSRANADGWTMIARKETMMAQTRGLAMACRRCSARLLKERTGEDVETWNHDRGLPDNEQELRAWLTGQGRIGYAQSLLVMERFGYPDSRSPPTLIQGQYVIDRSSPDLRHAIIDAAAGPRGGYPDAQDLCLAGDAASDVCAVQLTTKGTWVCARGQQPGVDGRKPSEIHHHETMPPRSA